MDIIHLILGKANPSRMNGVNRVVHELATRQQQTGRSVAVWGFTPNPVHDYPERNYLTQLFQAERQPFQVGAAWEAAILDKRDTAVVHLHGGFVPRFSGAARFLQHHGIPYLITPHGNYNQAAVRRSSIRKALYTRLFERPLLAGARAVHCLGQSELAGLNRLFPHPRPVLIPYGFDADETPAPAPSHFTIGFCGRLDTDHKGIDRLMDGFAQFHHTVPDCRLWLIGDGPQRAELEAQVAQLRLTNDVTFWGSRFGDEKTELLRQCSVFVHASRYEGLPVAVLEAAALGIPCLVSEATNMGRTVRAFDAGYVAETGSAEQVAEGLAVLYRRLCVHRDVTLRDNAHRMVREAYNWNRILEQFDWLYRDVWGRA